VPKAYGNWFEHLYAQSVAVCVNREQAGVETQSDDNQGDDAATATTSTEVPAAI
jgi:hypothetical protein